MRPRARLISLLGEELVSDERVSVVELVKNAYDADATEVLVSFEMNSKMQPIRLIISDNGHGMNVNDVVNGWLEPGTNKKKVTERSPQKNRLYQGAKGVGRFAAGKLGNTLLLETKKNTENGVMVLLDWGDFNDDSYLDQVDITLQELDKRDLSTGTTLAIEGVFEKKEWKEEDYENLHLRLSRLISPFKEFSDFKVILNIPGHPNLTGEVEPHPITKKPVYIFEGSLEKNGELNATLSIQGEKLQEYKNHKLGKNEEVVGCGGFDFEIRAWDRDKLGLSPLMLEFDMKLTGIRKTLDEYCGVSIYRDGFRIYPYGEKTDDWLTLNNRSRQNPTLRLAKNQIVSSIKTSRTYNPRLIDRTTREGLVHNEEFEQLQDWFIRVLAVLEEERYKFRPREDSKPEYSTSLFEAFDMSDVVSETRQQLGITHPVSKLVNSKDIEIRDGVAKLQAHYSRVLMAAGLGQLVDLVIHEIGAPLGRVSREISFIQRLLKKYDIEDDDKEVLGNSFKSVNSWLEQIYTLRSRLDPKTAGKRGRATSFSVAEEILGNLNLFENLIGKQNIKIELIQPTKPVIVHMSRSALGQIIANLLDNSIYWLTRHHGDGKGGHIKIQLGSLEHGFKIDFSDNGPGIGASDRERIFEQYFTSKPNGMGLGLYIARQVIEPYGKLIYEIEGSLAGANFKSTFIGNVGL